MPQIKISHVVSFSSEDSNYPACNLLSTDIVNKRWIGQKDDASNSVVLQLEKSIQISQVHIGNYHSAFVEVLVGRSEANIQNYEVLVCANSFMSPSDSRNSENINRVKTFSGDQLAADVKTKKWDRIRVVCTQSYNKHVQFGLSFIQIFSSEGPSTSITKLSETSSNSVQLGRFRLRQSSSDEEIGSSFKPGELFARKKQGFLSIDAEIRNAGKPETINSKDSTHLLVKTSRPNKPKSESSKERDTDELLSRKRDSILYDDDDDKKHAKIDRIMERDREEKHKSNESSITSGGDKKKDDAGTPKPHKYTESSKTQQKIEPRTSKLSKADDRESRDRNRVMDSKKRSSDDNLIPTAEKHRGVKKNEDTPPKQDVDDIPRGPQCLRGVVFVLSGYVNPKRSTLRDAAMAMGARYAPDWASHCTHLVCAFTNTPKYDQVKKSSPNAAIVNCQWIEECAKEQARVPWQWYALDPKQKIDGHDAPLPKPHDKKADSRIGDQSLPSSSRDIPSKMDVSESDTDDEIEKAMKQYEDSETKKDVHIKTKTNIESTSDTDIDADIIKKFNKNNATPKKESDSYTMDTPVKRDDKSSQSQQKRRPSGDLGMDETLLDLFQFTKFYIDKNLEDTKYDVEEIKRYIIAFGGEVCDEWPNKGMDVVVTLERFVSKLRFDGDKRCMYLRPEWIWKCNDTETLYPLDDYSV